MPTGHPDPPKKWRLVCQCENIDREDHRGQKISVYEGPSKHVVFGLAKRAGWRLSSRWKHAYCPGCTGGNGAHDHGHSPNKGNRKTKA